MFLLSFSVRRLVDNDDLINRSSPRHLHRRRHYNQLILVNGGIWIIDLNKPSLSHRTDDEKQRLVRDTAVSALATSLIGISFSKRSNHQLEKSVHPRKTYPNSDEVNLSMLPSEVRIAAVVRRSCWPGGAELPKTAWPRLSRPREYLELIGSMSGAQWFAVGCFALRFDRVDFRFLVWMQFWRLCWI